MMRWYARTHDALALLTLPYYIFGPYVDNWLGILTKRDLHRFFAFDVQGHPLRRVLERRLQKCEWSVRHEGYLWASVVECLAPGCGLFQWRSAIVRRDLG
jgi:hypothetical protein